MDDLPDVTDVIDVLQRTGVRGRIAASLLAVESAMAMHDTIDARIPEVVDVIWRFVEPGHQREDVDRAWRLTAAAGDLLEAMDAGLPVPASYGGVPLFLARAVYHSLWVGLSEMYGAVTTYGAESLGHTVEVLRLCHQNGVPLPNLDRCAQVRFEEQHGWGNPRPRSFFIGRA